MTNDILVGSIGQYKTYIQLSELKIIADKALAEENERLRDALIAILHETPALGGRKMAMYSALREIRRVCKNILEREE